MSSTSDIICLECREALWIGQGGIIYCGEEETMKMLNLFLQQHRGHSLTFDYSDYKDWYMGEGYDKWKARVKKVMATQMAVLGV